MTKKKDKPEWIAVTDRMPERSDADLYCEVWAFNGKRIFRVPYHSHGTIWKIGLDGKPVTHWMTPGKPEPPKLQGTLEGM